MQSTMFPVPCRTTARQVVLACVFSLTWSGFAAAESRYVANNGTNGPACGSSSAPCRSISQAISNANNGDVIVVGPGRYGDVNDDADFGDVGDEAAEVNIGCDCMIKVNKAVTIQSSNGAKATVLDAGGRPITVVFVLTNDVVFGVSKRGFTVRRGDFGLAVETGMTGVSVSANVATDNSGIGFPLSGNGTIINGNIATGNSDDGFSISGNDDIITANIALNNNGDGFRLNGANLTVTGNAATSNDADGFNLDILSQSVVRGNLASGNEEHGFELSDVSGTELTGNSTLGNKGFGFYLSGSIGAGTHINGNNLYGNNSPDFNGFTNCGLRNESGTAGVDATQNFWGAPAGPGADPADDVCDDAGGGSSTTTAPAATKAAKTKLKTAF